MVVGSLFGTSCVPVLHFVQPPPHNVRLSTAFSITVSLSVRQPTQLRLLLINANDLKPHKRFTIQPKQSPRFIQSTTYKFEGLRIEEMAVQQQHSLVTSMESELSTEAGSCMNGTDSLNGNIPEKCNEADWSDTQKSNAKIMIEASSPNASVTLLSDEITIDNEPFVFVELSHQVIEKPNETVWVLLNKEPTELNVVLSDSKRVEPVDAVKLYGKLVIFTLPSQLHPTSDTAESRQLPQTANVVNGADEFESNDSKDVLRTAEESSKEQRNSAEELGNGNERTVAEVADSKATESDVGAAGSSSTDPTAILTAKQPPSTNEMESESKTTAETVVESSPEVIAAHGNTPLSLTNLKIILQCGKQQIILPIRFQLSVTNTTEAINNEEFRSTQLSSLFNFASGGDPLALLSPFAHLLNETDSDGCKTLKMERSL
ncbi:unnamed protein product [Anisakis simplex]|uniref:PEX-1N domain-containing protein n=1 Tax=Anisakis simplex TaxID=6269 RepID=A0A0M3K577_ANISI|nr:unnamed protein product [Anisakis simplex]